jgi:hypothetical protein
MGGTKGGGAAGRPGSVGRPVPPPNNGGGTTGGMAGVAFAGGHAAGGVGGVGLGATGIGATAGGITGEGDANGDGTAIGGATGDGGICCGSGAAADGAEKSRVNSPGAGAGTAGGAAGAMGAAGGGVSGAEVDELEGPAAGAEEGAPNIWVKAPGAAAGAGAAVGSSTGAIGATGGSSANGGNVGNAGTEPIDGAKVFFNCSSSGFCSSVDVDGAPNICVKAPGAGVAAGGAARGGTTGGTGCGTSGGTSGGTTGAGGSATATTGAAGVGRWAAVFCSCSARGGNGVGVLAPAPARGAAPLLAASQAGNDDSPAMNSVTIAKPDGSVAVSSTRFLSAPDRRPSSPPSHSTSSGPAASARCTITTRPVANSCALCVRTPLSTATHFSRRYRALKSSLMGQHRR